MIDVRAGPSSIIITGHANYAPPGKDIVCAAVSTLTQTLKTSAEELTEDKIKFVISPGRADIEYENLSDKAQILVDSFLVGIHGIANKYPDYVRVTNGRPGTEAPGGDDKAGECSGRSGKEKK